MANRSDNLERRKRHSAALAAKRLSTPKGRKAKDARKRLKKIKRRVAKGLCGHCGKTPCLNAMPCQEKR